MKYYRVIVFGLWLLSANAQGIKISREDAKKIGYRIWHNECKGTEEGLTSWHPNERFASLGIAHCIWFPEGLQEPHQQTFPSLVEYLRSKKSTVPAWLIHNNQVIACPWKNKQEFDRNKMSEKMRELRKFLVDTIDLQICFVIEQFKHNLEKIYTTYGKRSQVRKQLQRLLHQQQGLYALIDYVNFKGTGLASSERYQNQGWGLLQVLEGMPTTTTRATALQDFVESAQKVLEMRVAHAPKDKYEERFLPGWRNRLKTYLAA